MLLGVTEQVLDTPGVALHLIPVGELTLPLPETWITSVWAGGGGGV